MLVRLNASRPKEQHRAELPPSAPRVRLHLRSPRAEVWPGRLGQNRFDLGQYGVRRALVITDPGVAATGAPQRIAEQFAA